MRSKKILAANAHGGYIEFRCADCRAILGAWQTPVTLGVLVAAGERYEHACPKPADQWRRSRGGTK